MKTIQKLKCLVMLFFLIFMISCAGTNKGTASDRTSNGNTNGNGKVPKSNAVHNFNNN
ncbi:hypothetical protein FNO01nite_11350 [Flavobacterium noncentrifugens]|uniref:Lipoprotein n=1 Tax=Flavobacterium noncentrifugens TaxID=1128970 RepID=A0A1G8VE25_9FLAO|nr:hypothetical protein [Flavobacterium noncentrifugens]GEP50463.1 hypothetical protein FNO01nite_11350 [Flavobacterium noncentrifugens]SDJ64288.1 hypothetical protein SAMN04487935_1309 [Flavobacterium noncentrifugens]